MHNEAFAIMWQSLEYLMPFEPYSVSTKTVFNKKFIEFSKTDMTLGSSTQQGTPKRKGNKKHKKAPREAAECPSSQVDDSSSTSVEDMEDETTGPSTAQMAALAPTSKGMQELEQKIHQLQEAVSMLTNKQEQEITMMLGVLTSTSNAVRAISADVKSSHRCLNEHEDSISQLQQLTSTLQDQVEDTEHKANSNNKRTEDIADSVSTLQTNYNNLQHNMAVPADEFRQGSAGASGGVSAATAVDTCETGIFISGIQEFIRHFKMEPHSDPVTVVGRLMREIDSYCAVNRIFIADRAVSRSNRHEARAVIVYLNSTFHKRQVMFLLKRLLENRKLRATVSDIFSAEETPRAMALTKLAADRRQDKTMTKTRVVNRNGTAVLQHTNGSSSDYKDADIPAKELQPYLKQRTTKTGMSATGSIRKDRMSNRRDRRDRNGGTSDREARDQERFNRRNLNNTDNSTYNNSPPIRRSTPSSQPFGFHSQPVAPQPGNHIHPQQQQQAFQHQQQQLRGVHLQQHPHQLHHHHNMGQHQQQGPNNSNVMAAHPQQQQHAFQQQQQQTRAVPFQQHPQQHHHNMGQQQQGPNNSSMMAAQQWLQVADGSTVINPIEYTQPVHPQMMAFLQQQKMNAQHHQQQFNNTTREDY
jgi:hypothetical protein